MAEIRAFDLSGKKDLHRKNLRILSIDIGGTKVKMLASHELEPRKVASGLALTPLKLVQLVKEETTTWQFDVITIGFPGLVGPNGPVAEPANLGPGWVAFDFEAAFGKPVQVVNDAVMQAVGSYEGGRMLFLGLGTGLGSTLIVDHTVLPLELSNLRWSARETIGDVVGRRALKRFGVRKWRGRVIEVVNRFMQAFMADYAVIGGGNAKRLNQLPPGARLGHNQTAFRGGYRIWGEGETDQKDTDSYARKERSDRNDRSDRSDRNDRDAHTQWRLL